MKNAKLFSTILTAILLISVLSSCSPETEPSAAPEPALSMPSSVDEGVDTAITITDYTAYQGEDQDMFLTSGANIAVISPCSLPSRQQVDDTLEGLRAWGYNPVEGSFVATEGRTTEQLTEDIIWALTDPDIDAIFCVRGGYGASHIMDDIALDLISDSHKLIIGYSDVTVYHNAWASAGLMSIHACMSGAFTLPEECRTAEQNMMQGMIPTYECESNSYCNPGEANGVLIGGNLSTFDAVIDSAYDYTRTGQPYILFLEDIGEDYNHIDRMLAILDHAGVLDNASGIIFGEWTGIQYYEGYNGNEQGGSYESVADMIDRNYFSDSDIPVAYGFPAGHGDINYPLLMGADAHLTVNEDTYTLTWE
ncbi:MAG: LD-carboxypeptidase [Saccharofermentans sp.]|nr:LD-carboxypeptidase [Saccharofermentans sp.]